MNGKSLKQYLGSEKGYIGTSIKHCTSTQNGGRAMQTGRESNNETTTAGGAIQCHRGGEVQSKGTTIYAILDSRNNRETFLLGLNHQNHKGQLQSDAGGT